MAELERTGWRDTWMSRRHRYMGSWLYGTDGDFIEYARDPLRPVALMEYENHNRKKKRRWCDMEVKRKLANAAEIPLWFVRYFRTKNEYEILTFTDWVLATKPGDNDDPEIFDPYADAFKEKHPQFFGRKLDEKSYSRFLHTLRDSKFANEKEQLVGFNEIELAKHFKKYHESQIKS